MAEQDKHDIDSDGDDNIGDDNAWNEVEFDPTPTKCLFCSAIHESPDVVFSHCKSDHKFDIESFSRKWRLDCFGFIKMVNYVRKQTCTAESLSSLTTDVKPPWDSDDYMRPVDPTDEMLQYDIEDMDDLTTMETEAIDHTADHDICNGGSTDTVVVGREEFEAQLSRLQIAENRVKETEESLQRVLGDLENMRKVSSELLMSQPVTDKPTSSESDDAEGEDDPYFSSYGHFSIHEEMLKDKVRTESYRDFMYHNKEAFRDKVVLDVGCGTGILSMFAVKAGAKHVYAVDMADIVYSAMDISRENGMTDKITFMKGKLEDMTLPVDKVDIIISEWMGYFLLFESMLDSVLFARAKFLKHDGVVYPDRCNISIAAMSDLDLVEKHISYWDDVYGFKMSCMKQCVVREASVELVKPEKIVTDSCIIKDIDICNCDLDELQFTSEFSLTVKKDEPITAFVGYFDTFFERLGSQKVTFSTGPDSTATHWKQTVFLVDKPLHYTKGDVLTGTLSCRKNRSDPRSLIITIKMKDYQKTYYME